MLEQKSTRFLRAWLPPHAPASRFALVFALSWKTPKKKRKKRKKKKIVEKPVQQTTIFDLSCFVLVWLHFLEGNTTGTRIWAQKTHEKSTNLSGHIHVEERWLAARLLIKRSTLQSKNRHANYYTNPARFHMGPYRKLLGNIEKYYEGYLLFFRVQLSWVVGFFNSVI